MKLDILSKIACGSFIYTLIYHVIYIFILRLILYVILSKNISYGYFSSYNFADAICLGHYPKNCSGYNIMFNEIETIAGTHVICYPEIATR